VNRGAGRVIAAAAYTWGWTPNMITAASAVASTIGVVTLLVAPPTLLSGIGIAFLFALGYALDSSDGQVARLSGTGSLAGEWLDHVVDAIRTPAQHAAVLVAFYKVRPDLGLWPMIAALLYCILSAGQAMSQMLAEQLSGRKHRPTAGGGVPKSLVLLPTDTGVFCWIFVLWGAPLVFAIAYSALFVINAFHALVSMRRKYTHLVNLNGAHS
jgi:phosphatidylglycerophosphate synthase